MLWVLYVLYNNHDCSFCLLLQKQYLLKNESSNNRTKFKRCRIKIVYVINGGTHICFNLFIVPIIYLFSANKILDDSFYIVRENILFYLIKGIFN